MALEKATPKAMLDMAAMAQEIANVFNRYAKTAEKAAELGLDPVLLNNLGTIRDRLDQSLERAKENSGKFDNLKARIAKADGGGASRKVK